MIRIISACSAYGRALLPLTVLFLSACGGGSTTPTGPTDPMVTNSGVPPCGIEGSGIHIQSCTPDDEVIPAGTSPGPAITFLTPSCAPLGAQAFTLSVDGSNLVASSVLRWNGNDLPNITVDTKGQSISAQIPASDVAAAGTGAITVFNPGPGPGGGSSSPVAFTIAPGGVKPPSVAVDPTGQFAYVVNEGCGGGFVGSVSMYKIESTGTLTSVGTIPAGSGAFWITIDPLGKFAYVVNVGSRDVFVCKINSNTGVLEPSGKTAAGTYPLSIAIDPSGKFAYVADSLGNDVLMYSIDPNTGALTSIGSTVPETGPLQTPWSGPFSVTIDPLGKFAYVAIFGDGGDESSGSVSVYTINPTTGNLTFTSSVEGNCGASLCSPRSVAIDHSGKFAVAVGGVVSVYTINAATGALTSIQTITAGAQPHAVALDPTGNFVYVTNFDSNDVSMYSMDPSTGTLTSMGTVAGGSSPTSIAIDPSGRFAYVVNFDSNDVSMYSIDPSTGVLTLMGTFGT